MTTGQPPIEPSPAGSAEDENCGFVPLADEPPAEAKPVAKAIEKSFPGAVEESGDRAKADLLNEVPVEHTRTRQYLEEPPTELPESMDGIFGEKRWVVPETDDLVALDVSKDSSLGSRHEVGIGQGIWQYDGGEPGVSTTLQQLPGKNVRIFKVIEDRTAAAPDAPTELSFHFERDCSGFFNRKCAAEDCGLPFSGQNCIQGWRLAKYSYLGTEGVLLIDPNTPSEVVEAGTPKAFLTAPVAFDKNQSTQFSTTGAFRATTRWS